MVHRPVGAPEILSGYLQVKTTFIIVNKTSFFFFFVCRDVCIGGINAMKDKTADALTQIQTEISEYGFCILYHQGLAVKIEKASFTKECP